MLYVSTRSKTDSYTAYRVLHENLPLDGGMFVPFQLQAFQADELNAIVSSSFYHAVAQVLNYFFSSKLTGWDLELCAGRNAAVCLKMSHKLIVAETWRNPEGRYAYFEKAVYKRISANPSVEIPSFVRTAIRTAVIFGIYSQISKSGAKDFDILTLANDSVTYLAAFYAQRLGLPIRTILIGCTDSNGLWELVHKGTTVPVDIGPETLVYMLYGFQENQRFVSAVKGKKLYVSEAEQPPLCQKGFFAAVVGNARLDGVISNVYRANGYVLTPDAAAMHCTLMDYRAKTGDSRETILFADENPLKAAKRIQSATGLTFEQISRQITPVKE